MSLDHSGKNVASKQQIGQFVASKQHFAVYHYVPEMGLGSVTADDVLIFGGGGAVYCL